METTYTYAPGKNAVLTLKGINCIKVEFPTAADHPSWIPRELWDADCFDEMLSKNYDVDNTPLGVLNYTHTAAILDYLADDLEDSADAPDYDPLLAQLMANVCRHELSILGNYHCCAIWQWERRVGVRDIINAFETAERLFLHH